MTKKIKSIQDYSLGGGIQGLPEPTLASNPATRTYSNRVKARSAVITAQGLNSELGNYFEILTYEGNRFLTTKKFKTFSKVARDIAQSDDEYGWKWINRSAGTLSIINCNEDGSVEDAAHIENATANVAWTSASRTAPVRYKLYENFPGSSFIVITRIKNNAAFNTQQSGLIVMNDGDDSEFFRLCIGKVTDSLKVESTDGTVSANASITQIQMETNGIWLMLCVTEKGATAYYSTSNQSTAPTQWTFLQESNFLSYPGISRKLRIGTIFISTTSSTLSTDILYYDDMAHQPNLDWDNSGASTWGAQGYEDSSQQIQLLEDFDLGIAAPTLDQAIIRNVLTDAVNRMFGNTASVEFIIRQGESTGITQDDSTFKSPGAVTVDSSGRYVSMWARFTPDSLESGSLKLPLILPIVNN